MAKQTKKEGLIKWNKVGFSGNKMFEFKKPGDELIGEYQGSREVKGGEYSRIHTVLIGEELRDFWGSGLLDKILSDENLKGLTLKIVYQGKKKIKLLINGKNKHTLVHQYDVYTAEL